MADYAISNVPRRVVYANSGVGPYAFTFEILSQTDISVYRGSTLLTLTTDYSVTINTNGTGSITLVTAGTGNITIVGAKNIQRTTDFTTGGDLFANTLNDELDNQTIFIQQVAETAERGLKAPVTDPTDIAMTLPAKAGRAGKVLAFDSTTGNPVAGPALDAVTTVIEQSANINTVADNIASVNTVAGNTTNINTVAGVSGNVTTVASSISNVNTVASDLNEPVSEINTVAVNISDVNTVGTNIASVNTVAGISSNVTTVAGISSAVTTVSTNNANVSTVATNISAVNTNASNITAIQNASTNATNAANSASAASTSATNAANSATAAGNAQTAAEAARDATLAAYDSFDDRYLGSKTSDPTLDNDGNALVAGALYFNSVSGIMKLYTGSAWVAAYVSGAGYLAAANNLSDLASAASARTNLGLGTIATQNANNVNLTGGSISGITDLAVADGGTGSSTASGARTNLGLAIGTDVQAYSAALTSYATNGVAMRNRIINGAMVIDQRNAGASLTITSSGQYCLDRWRTGSPSGSKFSVQQNAGSVTTPSGFNKYLGVTSLAATTVTTTQSYNVQQLIEGYNIADLNWGTANAKAVTLSFWVRSSLTGTFGGAVVNGGQNRSYVFSYSIPVANTWTLISTTIAGDTTGTWPTDNSAGLSLRFSLGTSSDLCTTAGSWNASNLFSVTGETQVVATNGATFYITGVQLEVGSSATGFEYRQYQQELALCQRYYEVITITPSTATLASGQYSASYFTSTWQFKVNKRTAPTYTVGAGGYSGSTPTATLAVDNCYLSSSSAFYLNGTGGNVAATVSAEL